MFGAKTFNDLEIGDYVFFVGRFSLMIYLCQITSIDRNENRHLFSLDGKPLLYYYGNSFDCSLSMTIPTSYLKNSFFRNYTIYLKDAKNISIKYVAEHNILLRCQSHFY